MRDYIDAGLGPRRFNLSLVAAFSLTGVMLAVLGSYGLISSSVSQRRREIGLRMAIGASEHDIHRMILGQAAFLGMAGAMWVVASPLSPNVCSHALHRISRSFFPRQSRRRDSCSCW
jgi:hypothetical protein